LALNDFGSRFNVIDKPNINLNFDPFGFIIGQGAHLGERQLLTENCIYDARVKTLFSKKSQVRTQTFWSGPKIKIFALIESRTQ
jgi:hypothetical protein